MIPLLPDVTHNFTKLSEIQNEILGINSRRVRHTYRTKDIVLYENGEINTGKHMMKMKESAFKKYASDILGIPWSYCAKISHDLLLTNIHARGPAVDKTGVVGFLKPKNGGGDNVAETFVSDIYAFVPNISVLDCIPAELDPTCLGFSDHAMHISGYLYEDNDWQFGLSVMNGETGFNKIEVSPMLYNRKEHWKAVMDSLMQRRHVGSKGDASKIIAEFYEAIDQVMHVARSSINKLHTSKVAIGERALNATKFRLNIMIGMTGSKEFFEGIDERTECSTVINRLSRLGRDSGLVQARECEKLIGAMLSI